jgi:glyoxylase-like metal-dependent hydrolase (beta-lactamase superfamily II)
MIFRHPLVAMAVLGSLSSLATAESVSESGPPATSLSPLASQTNANQALQRASRALGVQGLHSVEFSGSGFDFALGQAPTVSSPWPKFVDKSYDRVVSFEPLATRLQRTRTQADQPPRGGGGQPVIGEQTQTQTVAAGTPAAATLPDDPALTLPQAFLRQAAAAKDVAATSQIKAGRHYSVITYTALNRAKTRGWIDDHDLVERVETQIDNPVLGDTPYEVTFSDYKDFNGLKFPTHIVQKQGGYPVLDLNVADVKANVPVDIQPAPAPPAPTLASEQLGDGVYLITGGYAAIAVAFKDHTLIIEGGQNDQRSKAVIAEAQRLFPGKPITELINTHPHFDHAGGVRAYVAAGATIITYKSNQAYFEKVWANPHTLAPDELSQHPRKATFKLVDDHLTLTDGNQVVELYHLHEFGHHEGSLIAYLPKEKVLVEADAFNPPPAPVTQTPSQLNVYQLSLLANIQRLKLDVDRIVPIHLPADNRKVTLQELLTATGKVT